MAKPGQDQQGAAPAAGQPQELTEHEAAIYDRQLRVWGVETQKRQAITCQHLPLLPPLTCVHLPADHTCMSVASHAAG